MKHWKKMTAFFFIIAVDMISRSMGWLDNQWYGIILLGITVFYLVAECFDNHTDLKFSVGPTGASIETKEIDQEGIK